MRREAVQRRTPARRASRRTILLYCGAARTEPDYFNGLKSALRTSSVTVKIRQEGVDPARLVRVAADYRDRHPGVYEPSGIGHSRNPSTNVWQLIDRIEEQA
jgi:hypothetical protein